jgi:hypothetical protein
VISPDEYLKRKVPEFVAKGDFGLASGDRPGGGFDRVWFREPISPDEVAFDAGVYLLRRERAEALRTGSAKAFSLQSDSADGSSTPGSSNQTETTSVTNQVGVSSGEEDRILTLTGAIPPELWNRVGTRLIPKLRSAQAEPRLGVNFDVEVAGNQAAQLERDLQQAIADLGLTEQIKVGFK